MAQLKHVTSNMALCKNNSLVSAAETQERGPANPSNTNKQTHKHPHTHTHAHTRLPPFERATHWGLIDAAHSYWTTDVRESRGNYKQPPLWDHSLEEAWGRRILPYSGSLLFTLFTLHSISNSMATGSPHSTGKWHRTGTMAVKPDC